MRFKSLITLILTISLAVITSNAMAKGKHSGKSDKSAKHSQKSDKSAKSGKSGKSDKSRKGHGYGHCKSDKSGKGHSKKRGKGHNRDCDDDTNPPEPVELTCSADVSEYIVEEELFDTRGGSLGFVAKSITNEGQICKVDDKTAYQDTVEIVQVLVGVNKIRTRCEFSPSDSSVSALMESETEYWYDMTSVLKCETREGPF